MPTPDEVTAALERRGRVEAGEPFRQAYRAYPSPDLQHLADTILLADDYPRILAENADLRDAIRLLIGRQGILPWCDVPDADVDSYLNVIRGLKARAALKETQP